MFWCTVCFVFLPWFSWFFVGHQGESDSESSETSDSIRASSVSGCLEGVAVPRQMVVPLILATMAEVAQYGVASSLGEIGAQMTDPDSCTGAAGKEVYRWLSGRTSQSFPFQVRLLLNSSGMYPHDFTLAPIANAHLRIMNRPSYLDIRDCKTLHRD